MTKHQEKQFRSNLRSRTVDGVPTAKCKRSITRRLKKYSTQPSSLNYSQSLKKKCLSKNKTRTITDSVLNSFWTVVDISDSNRSKLIIKRQNLTRSLMATTDQFTFVPSGPATGCEAQTRFHFTQDHTVNAVDFKCEGHISQLQRQDTLILDCDKENSRQDTLILDCDKETNRQDTYILDCDKEIIRQDTFILDCDKENNRQDTLILDCDKENNRQDTLILDCDKENNRQDTLILDCDKENNRQDTLILDCDKENNRQDTLVIDGNKDHSSQEDSHRESDSLYVSHSMTEATTLYKGLFTSHITLYRCLLCGDNLETAFIPFDNGRPTLSSMVLSCPQCGWTGLSDWSI